MEQKINIKNTYCQSEDVVAREIHGEFIIIPITSGIGDLEDELYTLNETGKNIWDRLDGKKSLKEIAMELSKEFDAPLEEIEKDVAGLTEELLVRRIVLEV
ncbi:MAG TPA: PqqD family protein [Candidatus Eremiobacteraeota bacterium]|nr:MAG: Coenzyme PQQ synthesis protein D [bacterium ADurb.Bin363]HPZ09234.1 PqqD family protein [Candidatus Eremiobacteraeota bacterium]